MTTSAPNRETWLPATEDDRRLVRAELERILQSPPFRNSRRYPALLKYVVEKSLEGIVDHLKERTIGVEVFARPLDYDTSEDPIVRFTAGEVRKRIAQFYQDGNSRGPIEINLPVGGYVPQFFRHGAGEDKTASADSLPFAVDLAKHGSDRAEHTVQPDSKFALVPPLHQPDFSDKLPDSHPSRHALPRLAMGIALLLCVVACLVYVYRAHQAASPILAVWGPLLKSPDRVLISAGRPHPEEQDLPDPADTTIGQHFMRPEFRLSLTAVAAISQVAGFLESQHKRFQIHEAYSNNLQDLHGHPVVLINGNDNKWTVLLLRPLRFHFVQAGDFAYIEDNQHPEKRDWSVDFNRPFLKQDFDYAIVARFQDATTGGPVIVIAGVSSNGTEAAGEFMVSPEQLEALAHYAPHGSLDRNFEAVLKVEVVGGNTGAATIVAAQFW